MSRIGKQTIAIPTGTEVSVAENTVKVKGPLGEVSRSFRNEVEITIENNEITFAPKKDTPFANAMWGTVASHVKNMVTGVNTKFEKKLIVDGVGYRVELAGKNLKMNLGFSHPVEMEVPEGLEVTVEKNVIVLVGIDKELVGSFAANVRAKKKPEPYKGKGIHYDGEEIRRKQGKKTA